MAIVYDQKIDNGRIVIREITESREQLVEYLQMDEDEALQFGAISSLKRQMEWLAVRVTLQSMWNKKTALGYRPDGAPFLIGRCGNISISHTSRYVAVIYHETNLCGIDIEIKSRQVGRVAARFLSAQEWQNCGNSDDFNQAALLHWCAKEAVFKMIPFGEIDFASQILLRQSNHDCPSFFMECSFLRKTQSVQFRVNFIFFEDIAMAWCTLAQDALAAMVD